MLPFQGEMIVGHFTPTRWVGLASVAPSGRRKISFRITKRLQNRQLPSADFFKNHLRLSA
jgi:hypothetical protein